MNSSKREKTPWIKLRKKPGPKKNERGEYLFDDVRGRSLLSEFMAATTFFGSHSVDWMYFSLDVATTFLLFR